MSTPDQNPLRAMHRAIEASDASAVRALLGAHEMLRQQINVPVFDYNSPALVHFAGRGDVAMVDVLLEFGADPNMRSSWWAGGFHALHSATPEVAERLLSAGAVADACAAAHMDRADMLAELIARNPESVHERGGDGQTPLHFARSVGVADTLLAAGADINARDVDHRATPAQWMLDRRQGAGRYALAEYLVAQGATADIFLASALGLTDRVRALLTSDSTLLELRTTQGEYGDRPPSSHHIYMWTIGANLSPMQVAAQFGHADTLAVMQSFATLHQRLIAALSSGDGEALEVVLQEQPGVLGLLGAERASLLPDAAWAAHAPAVALMLRAGFDVASTNHKGATALHCAAWQGSADCVRLLLQQPNVHTLFGVHDFEFHNTPMGWCLHGSCYGPKGDHATVVRLLLDAGARPDTDHDFGNPADAVRLAMAEWHRQHPAA